MPCFLVSTEHLTDSLWFRDNEDFTVCMNYIAITAFRTGVTVLAFVLMSNHVHFVLRGDAAQVRKFIFILKKMFSRYCRIKYGKPESLRHNGIDIRELNLEDEAIERAIAYVLMNPVSANICLHATQYRWGSGSVYFSDIEVSGTPLGLVSKRMKKAILHSHIILPNEYILTTDGYIHPSCYIPVKEVERIFRTPNRLHYFLATSSKARKDELLIPSFKDQLLAEAADELSMSLFHKRYVKELSPAQTAELLRQMRRRFSADPAQLARVTGLDYSKAVALIDSFPETCF